MGNRWMVGGRKQERKIRYPDLPLRTIHIKIKWNVEGF